MVERFEPKKLLVGDVFWFVDSSYDHRIVYADEFGVLYHIKGFRIWRDWDMLTHEPPITHVIRSGKVILRGP